MYACLPLSRTVQYCAVLHFLCCQRSLRICEMPCRLAPPFQHSPIFWRSARLQVDVSTHITTSTHSCQQLSSCLRFGCSCYLHVNCPVALASMFACTLLSVHATQQLNTTIRPIHEIGSTLLSRKLVQTAESKELIFGSFWLPKTAWYTVHHGARFFQL